MYLEPRLKEKALRMIIRIGTGKILKATEKLYSRKAEFKEIIIPEAESQFELLKTQDEAITSASSEKIKRMISPLLMCLYHKSNLFLKLIDRYDKLVPDAKALVLEKFTAILKSILQPPEVTGNFFEALMYQRESSENREEYKPLIQAFQKYIKIKGGKVPSIFSEAIVDFVIKTGKTEVLREFKEDIVIEKLIKILIHISNQQDFSYFKIKELADITGLSILEMLIEVVFYQGQSEESLAILRKLQELEHIIMQHIDLNDLSKPEFFRLMLLRLNKILPNAQRIHKETKKVPQLFFPFLLKIILLLQRTANMNKPWELFIELVNQLIKGRKWGEPAVWKGLVIYCKFDIELAESKILPLLPLDDREKLRSELYNR